jgi:hypothetical protein
MHLVPQKAVGIFGLGMEPQLPEAEQRAIFVCPQPHIAREVHARHRELQTQLVDGRALVQPVGGLADIDQIDDRRQVGLARVGARR